MSSDLLAFNKIFWKYMLLSLEMCLGYRLCWGTHPLHSVHRQYQNKYGVVLRFLSFYVMLKQLGPVCVLRVVLYGKKQPLHIFFTAAYGE